MVEDEVPSLDLLMNYPEQDQARRRLAKQERQPPQGSSQQQYDTSQWFNYDLDENSFKVLGSIVGFEIWCYQMVIESEIHRRRQKLNVRKIEVDDEDE